MTEVQMPANEESPAARPLAVRHVFIVMMVALVGGALLNAQAILRTAERLEIGTGRSVAVGIAEPLASISAFLRIDTPRTAINEVLGRDGPRRELTVAAPTTTTTPPPTTTTTSGGGQASPTTTVPAPSPTTTAAPGLRSITDAAPLDLWIIGDSFAEMFGPALVNRSDDTGVVAAGVDFRYVSGLTRPDFFDWPAYMAEQLPEVNPDAVVVIFGGNDAQPVLIDGDRVEVGEQAWIDLYAQRVGVAMDILAQGADRTYWIGLPIMESRKFTATVQMLNAVYEAEAAKRPHVTYVSSFELFTDEDGTYSAYLDGRLMRYSDGAHFSWNGAYRLADAVLAVIADEWDLDVAN